MAEESLTMQDFGYHFSNRRSMGIQRVQNSDRGLSEGQVPSRIIGLSLWLGHMSPLHRKKSSQAGQSQQCLNPDLGSLFPRAAFYLSFLVLPGSVFN